MTRTLLGLMNFKVKHAMELWLDLARDAQKQHEMQLKIARFKARMTRGGTHRIFLHWVDFLDMQHHHRALVTRMLMRLAYKELALG
jgi:hypothetical protein